MAKTEKKIWLTNFEEKHRGALLYQPNGHEMLELFTGLASINCVPDRSFNKFKEVRGGKCPILVDSIVSFSLGEVDHGLASMLLNVRGDRVEFEDDQSSNCNQEVKVMGDSESFLNIRLQRILI